MPWIEALLYVEFDVCEERHVQKRFIASAFMVLVTFKLKHFSLEIFSQARMGRAST